MKRLLILIAAFLFGCSGMMPKPDSQNIPPEIKIDPIQVIITVEQKEDHFGEKLEGSGGATGLNDWALGDKFLYTQANTLKDEIDDNDSRLDTIEELGGIVWSDGDGTYTEFAISAVELNRLDGITGALYYVGGTDVAVTDGGTGSSTAAGARTNLGLGTASTRAAEDTLTDGSNLPDGAAIKAYNDTNYASITHASRHTDGGADPIDGDKIEITWPPDVITPDTSPAEADSVDDLTAILEGIENYLSNLEDNKEDRLTIISEAEIDAGTSEVERSVNAVKLKYAVETWAQTLDRLDIAGTSAEPTDEAISQIFKFIIGSYNPCNVSGSVDYFAICTATGSPGQYVAFMDTAGNRLQSSLIFPNSANPTGTTEGLVEWDSDDDMLVVGDGSSPRVVATAVVCWTPTVIYEPDVLDASTEPGGGVFPIKTFDAAQFPGGVTLTKIVVETSATCTDAVNIEEWSNNGTAWSEDATTDAITLSGVSTTETTITDSAVDAGDTVMIDLPAAASDVDWIKVHLCGRINTYN